MTFLRYLNYFKLGTYLYCESIHIPFYTDIEYYRLKISDNIIISNIQSLYYICNLFLSNSSDINFLLPVS